MDINGSDGDLLSCAQAIANSIYSFLGEDVKLAGQCSDSGGGVILESLANHLKTLNATVQSGVYHVANCTLHAIQLTLKTPIEAVFGKGGVDKRNVMQLVHSAYDLMKSFICAYHHAYLVPHFHWLQKADTKGKKAGFRSRNILERYYLMRRDLVRLRDHWENDPSFSKFVHKLEGRVCEIPQRAVH